MKRHYIEDRERAGEIRASNKGREENGVGCIHVYTLSNVFLHACVPVSIIH